MLALGDVMDNDEIIKTLSVELLKGAKMLSTHCSKCGSPLLEKNGKIYCPICEKSLNTKRYKKENKNEENLHFKDELNLDKVIISKISYLSKKLEDEEEVIRIKEIAEALSVLIKIKEKLSNSKN
ncbi:Sjogrens syndrome scleroderma autoantigen 1 [Methanocaldococcus vulcanius M7]|uniref:Sjogrens syndrome scleroderma autoantigen 1 n=2 Tax=Methanocaldococcus TaxID=196118 RepID=C9REF8_METVM|nr:Sjogrens syndrome scleroderma autoantigen 1 [Methanocaldococcus vulcanius M7]